jgi:PAS domain S-box-containing protein
MKDPRRKVPETAELVTLVFAFLVVLLSGILAYRAGAAFNRSAEQTAVTRQIGDTTNALLSSLKDAETGQRGFLLTGDDDYLEPYPHALAEISPALETLTRIEAARNRPDEAQRVERLKLLVKDKLDELDQTIELRRSQDLDAALTIVRTDRGKAGMDQIRAICAEIQTANYALLNQQREATRTIANQSALIGVVGSATLFALLALATVTIQRGTSRRKQLIDSLDKSEAQARESRDWLQTALSSIGDAVIATDADGKVTLLNPVAQALTGWKQDEAAGKPLDRIFVIRNEDTGLEVENPVSRVLREGGIVGLANHTQLTAKCGRHVPIDDSAAPIRDAGGKIAGVVLVFRDITTRKEAEQAVERSMEELRVSNAALLRANEDLNQFGFAASHDLQEPLRMITSYSQLLVKGYRGQLDGEAPVCVQFITEGTKRMRELLADLLAYTRLTGDDPEAAESIDLNLVFQKTLENCKAAIEENKASVTSDHLPAVPGYEPHFVQLFQNLIGNALKYCGEQTPRIHVSAVNENGLWRLSVADNGIGIAPEYHQSIFGVFKRLHGRSIPGTGIGLAICQRVVERYDGRIWVESEVNRGATFYFTLPAAEGAAAYDG